MIMKMMMVMNVQGVYISISESPFLLYLVLPSKMWLLMVLLARLPYLFFSCWIK